MFTVQSTPLMHMLLLYLYFILFSYIENTLNSLSVKEENGQQKFCFSTEAYNEWLVLFLLVSFAILISCYKC